jgi:hypothetical protein
MFRANWPSSGVQVVMVKDSAAHCNAVFFPPIVHNHNNLYILRWPVRPKHVVSNKGINEERIVMDRCK